MADGDEKIDHNDRVLVLNRVSDDKTEVTFNGVTTSWKPGEVKSIQRVQAFEHFVPKSLVRKDPTYETYPIERLVVVNEQKVPVNAQGETYAEIGVPLELQPLATPLTRAQVFELSKYGSIDTSKLPIDRLVGGAPLIDEDGKFLTGVALRSADPRAGAPAQP